MGNAEVVQQALAAVRGGNLDAASDVVAPDFVWHIPGRSSISGDVTGAEAWSAKLGRLLGAGLQPAMIGILEDEQRVVALQHNTAQSGEHSLDVNVVNVFTVNDGKVRRLDTYFSDQYAADSFWSAVLS
jgi:ketosteroid isomerase-like protein